KTVYDAAKFLSVMAGRDEKDATTADLPVPQYHLNLETEKKFTLGLIKEYFEGLDKKFTKVIETAVKKLEAKGHKIKQLSIPAVKYAYPMYCLTVFAEIASNLSRFDGIRYGYDRDRFGEEAKRRIMIGTHSASSGYADQYYNQAMVGRKMLTYQFKQALETVDAFIGPVFPFPPFKIGEKETDPLKMYLSDVLTVPANLTGQPAMSVPIDFVDGMPNGLQVICKHFDEQTMFQIASQVEQEYQMYKIRPKLI
ncbi:MAG TPA: amidase family protein, partial [Patescibacteria group bacterium]|nr:amidase family protein [Patescibacteria group bacterium]